MTAVTARTLRRLVLQARRLVAGEGEGLFRGRSRGRGLAFEELRPYQPGDDIRRIDAKATARRGEPIVKLYAEDRRRTVWLLLDDGPTMDWGPTVAPGLPGLASVEPDSGRVSVGPDPGKPGAMVGPAKSAVAREAAALLALAAGLQGDRVGLAAGGERSLRRAPRASRRHSRRVAADALAAPADGPATTFVETVARFRRAARRPALVAVLSDFLATGAATFAPLAARHAVVALHVVHPWERALPNLGLARWTDNVTGRRTVVDTGDARYRAAYALAARRREEELGRALAALGVARFVLQTDRPVAATLARHFAGRQGATA